MLVLFMEILFIQLCAVLNLRKQCYQNSISIIAMNPASQCKVLKNSLLLNQENFGHLY